MILWHIITCEYPPRMGGVSHYIYLVASGLAAAGDEVHVWCPPGEGAPLAAPGVTVHPELGRMSPADLRRTGRLLNEFPAPRRLFVQWVPHGYGYQSMNLPFCHWLWQRAARNHDRVELMVHEPYLPFAGTWKQHATAVVHRLMIAIILRAPQRVWMSIPAWEEHLRPYAMGRQIPFIWLPVLSNVPEGCKPQLTARLRAQYTQPGGLLLGHYGTFGRPIVTLLKPLLLALLRRHLNLSVLLMGPRSEALRDELVAADSELVGRMHASGALTVEDCSHYLKACDLLIQPYPDGVSSRRTTMMAGLALQLPIVTTAGELSESLWAESGAVLLAAVGDADGFVAAAERLMRDGDERSRIGLAGRKLYEERFTLQRVIATLRNGNRPTEGQE